MILVLSTRLSTALKEQYQHLLEESDSEPSLDGVKLDPSVKRIVFIDDGVVIGACEITYTNFEDKSYFRTNRPYLMKQYRGRGLMFEALSYIYRTKRLPSLARINDDNESSIRLFTRLGFVRGRAEVNRGKEGHFYFLG